MKLIVRCPRGSLCSAAFGRTEAAEAGPHDAKSPATRAVRGRTWTAWAVPVALIALCAAGGSLRDGGWRTTRMQRGAGNGSRAVEQVVEKRAKPRLVYPFSVVPGGIEDGAEVAEALARDPVVEAHYAGFRADRARVVLLNEPRLVHVSYRVKDKVYWTRKKVKLQKGEKLITDGKEFIRARCGNRISDAPKGRTVLVDPPEVSLDAPLLPLPLVALAKPIEAPAGAPAPVEEEKEAPAPLVSPVAPAGRTGIVPITVPFGGGGGGIPPGSLPPVPVSGSPAGTPASGGTPPGTPPVAPPAPVANPPAQPPSAPPPMTPGNPPSGGGTPPSAPPSNPPSTPSTAPPSVPPGTQPSPPAPGTPSVTPPSSVPPGVTPPAGTPSEPAEPPLPGDPAVPSGVTPPGPGPIPPPEPGPPPGAPGPKPEPPPVTPIPEPSTYVLIGCGLAGMALLRRRRNRT